MSFKNYIYKKRFYSLNYKKMVEEAEKLGADAIVCVRYASSSVMQNAAEVMAYGTAVKFKG